MSACVDSKVLQNEEIQRQVFKILDANGDGSISLDDFDNMTANQGGPSLDKEIWEQLLMEADVNGDGIVNFDEFK